MPRTDEAILQFERRLRQEADRFAEGLRCHLAGVAPPVGEVLDPAARARRVDALVAEDARLRRKARRGAPCYDLNRHIAIRRLLALWAAPRLSA